MSLVVSGNPTFTRQGNLDWVSLSKESVSASVASFSRLSAANIDPFTVVVGRALSANFSLSIEGQKRIKDALASLRCFSSIGTVLWFGFGMKHVIRDLSQTNHGTSCIALCSALSEVFSCEVSATILSELARIHGPPEALSPSLQQWESLVSSCSGLLTTSSFGVTAEHFMSLNGDPYIVPRRADSSMPSRLPGEPEDIAKALRAIGSLSRGSLASVTLEGGSTCGWLAAVGYWLCGLDVEIRSSDGIILMRTAQEPAPVHIAVRYGRSNGFGVTTDVQITSTAFVIRDIRELFGGLAEGHNSIVTGRVPWDRVIRDTFGSAGRKLLQSTHHFSQLLGSAARIFTAVATAEPVVHDDPDIDLQYFRGYSDNSFGRGFILFAVAQLPELAPLGDTMERFVEGPFTKACEDFEMAFSMLRTLCGCASCHGRVPEMYEDKLANLNTERRHGFCIPILAEVIAIMLWSLSFVCFDVELLPTRAGPELVYQQWAGGIMNRINLAKRFGYTICSLKKQDVFLAAEAIFTGSLDIVGDSYHSPENARDAHSAFSSRGICFYLDILREVSDRPEDATRLRVVPGHIQHQNGRCYRSVRDSGKDEGQSVYPSYEADKPRPLKCLLHNSEESVGGGVDSGVADLKADLIVKETARCFLIDIRFSRASTGELVTFIGPARLVEELISVSGRVHCSRRHCQILSPPFPPSMVTVKGEGSLNPENDAAAGNSIVIRRLSGHTIARCLGILIPRRDFRQFVVILRRRECLSCCIRTAVSLGKPVVYVIE